MQQEQHPEFCRILAGLAEMYGKPPPSPAVIAMWWQSMKDFDLSIVKKALSAHVMNPDNGQFMPKPADVIRLMGGTTKDKALVAWSMVDLAVRQVGTYQDVVFPDPIIHAVITDMGGWIPLGQRTDDQWDFVKNEFVTRYRGYSNQGGVSEYLPVLTGISNAQNAMNGFRLNPPILLGDKDKAKSVYMSGRESSGVLPRQPMDMLQLGQA